MMHTTIQTFGNDKIFFINILKKSHAHQGCIYLI